LTQTALGAPPLGSLMVVSRSSLSADGKSNGGANASRDESARNHGDRFRSGCAARPEIRPAGPDAGHRLSPAALPGAGPAAVHHPLAVDRVWVVVRLDREPQHPAVGARA